MLCGLLAFGMQNRAVAQEAKTVASGDTNADAVWKELQKALRPPTPPEEWREKRPTPEEIEKFKEKQRELSAAAADKAKDFYTRFPKHANASEAKAKEHEMLGYAVQLGATNQNARLAALENERLKDPSLSDDERFELRKAAVQREAKAKQPDGMEAVMAQFEKGVRELQTEFPKQEEVYQMLMMVLQNSSGEKSRALADELVKSSAPDEIKEAAKAVLKKMDMVGKPLNIKFTAVDGREIDISKMAGKVLLIDFWATWCGPCIAELPQLDAIAANNPAIKVLTIDQDTEKLDMVAKFLTERGVTRLEPWLNPDNSVMFHYEAEVLPTTVLYDSAGKEVWRTSGPRDWASAETTALLAEAK